MTTLKRDDLTIDTLITYSADGAETCLGYLVVHEGNAFDAEHGLVEGVTAQEAEAHNAALSGAEVAGLDTTCGVGQGATFYVRREGPRLSLRTWHGDMVGDLIPLGKAGYALTRGYRAFRCQKPSSHGQAVFLRRTA